MTQTCFLFGNFWMQTVKHRLRLMRPMQVCLKIQHLMFGAWQKQLSEGNLIYLLYKWPVMSCWALYYGWQISTCKRQRKSSFSADFYWWLSLSAKRRDNPQRSCEFSTLLLKHNQRTLKGGKLHVSFKITNIIKTNTFETANFVLTF